MRFGNVSMTGNSSSFLSISSCVGLKWIGFQFSLDSQVFFACFKTFMTLPYVIFHRSPALSKVFMSMNVKTVVCP